MADKNEHFSNQAELYARYRPDYPDALFEWLFNQCANFEFAVDCATGNGQTAKILAQKFQRVFAIDISAAQLKNAVQAHNIEYHCGPVESLPVNDSSVDLITISQALHWFEFDRFFDEAKRILKPNGLVAEWGYDLVYFSLAIDQTIREIYEKKLGETYWEPQRRHIDNHYRDIPFPFKMIKAPSFTITRSYTLHDLCQYLNTWSAIQSYNRINKTDLINNCEQQLKDAWGPNEQQEAQWEIFSLVGKAA